jgi:23S rRNA pseudouridine2604 synthase
MMLSVLQRSPFLLPSLLLLLCSNGALGFHSTTSTARLLHRTTRLFQATESSSNVEQIRLNKVFKASLSRRQADRVIEEGRVVVNGEVTYGCMVVPYQDVVELDGTVVKGWEQMNGLGQKSSSGGSAAAAPVSDTFEYVKYWKPRGVVCTTDRNIRDNIIDVIMRSGGYRPKHRVYPVGRLDKDSSGLILLTSDGRLPNNSLRRSQKQPKVYQCEVDRPLSDVDIDNLRNGIVITTIAQRDGKSKPLTARTKQCQVYKVSETCCEITLMEGRNRQIRKMMDALGYEVVDLHRVRFGNIAIDDMMNEGDWKRLDGLEMEWIEKILEETAEDDNFVDYEKEL